MKKILIIRLSGLGDVVCSLPLLSALRRKFPEDHIAWLVSSKAKDVVSGHPYLDEVIVFEKNRGLSAVVPLVRKLRRAGFEMVIDPQSQTRSGIISLLSGAPVRIGFTPGVSKEPNSIFMNEKVLPGPGETHNVDRDLSFARHLGIDAGKKEFNIYIGEEDREYIDNFLKQSGIKDDEVLVGLSIAGSLPNRKWSNRNWAALVDELSSLEKKRAIILWGPGEEEKVKEIIESAGGAPLIAPGTNLKQLAALLSCCKLVIANDSGPMHLAVAMGTPVIGLHGPSNIERTGPYGDMNIAIRKDLTALKCFSHGRKDTRCKKFRSCEKTDCMELITVKDVMGAVKKMMGRIK